MKIQDVLLYLNLYIHVLVDFADSLEENCYRGDQYFYNNPCAGQDGQPAKLSLCDKGQKLAESCTESCEFCDPGTYADQKNNCLRCKPCLTECPEGQVIIKQCTSESDAVCGCPLQQCPTNPQPTCPSCPVVTPCPTLPKLTDSPETSSELEVLLQFTKECPLPIEKLTDDVGNNISVSWEEPEATPGSLIAYQSYKPGHQFPIGHFEAVYVFTNSSGATIACSFPISVKASVKATSQPISDPPEGNFLSYVIGFVVGVVITILFLFFIWCLCYCFKKLPCLKRRCPPHRKNADNRGRGEHENLLPGACANGANQGDQNHIPPAQNVQRSRARAAAELQQAGGGCNGDQNKDTAEVQILMEDIAENGPKENQQNGKINPSNFGQARGGEEDQTPAEEVEPENIQNGMVDPSDVGRASEEQQNHPPVEEIEAENDQQNGEIDPSDDDQASGGQEDHSPTEDSSQQSPSLPPQSSSLPNYSAVVVNLPPENSPSTSTNTQSQGKSLTSQGNEELDDIEKLENPDVEVAEGDIDELADMVVKNSDYYELKDTFVRRIIGYKMQRGLAIDIEREKTDPSTKLVQYIIHGWWKRTLSRKRSDLVAKIRKFNKSLEQEFIIYLNGLDES